DLFYDENTLQDIYNDLNKSKYPDIYFARLESELNISGFVYQNSGSIENSFANIPMETQSRTAGFVYDNSNAGEIKNSYTVCYYDGASQYNSAHAFFIGTNELGEVLNDTEKSSVQYSYYIISEGNVEEDDIIFKDPATRLSLSDSSEEDDEDVSSTAISPSAYVGFDVGENKSNVWKMSYEYGLLTLNSNDYNQTIRRNFRRTAVQYIDEKSNEVVVKFPRSDSTDVPLTIANALQFVNTFALEVDGALMRDVRLINDIDLAEFAGRDELNDIRNVVYVGDFDGNGMKIDGIRIVGINDSDENQSIYSNVSSSFGLFNQIGTATVHHDLNNNGKYDKNVDVLTVDFNPVETQKTYIRNLTLNVKEVSRSTSAYTGILAGVIVNTDVKSLKINAEDVIVLGRNAVGGVAGAIIGNSTLYDISVNASAQSSYMKYANTAYVDKTYTDFTASSTNTYQFIDYYKLYKNSRNKYDSILDKYNSITASSSDVGTHMAEFITTTQVTYKGKTYYSKTFNLSKKALAYSYAGGIAGIIDIYDEYANMDNVDDDSQENFMSESRYDSLTERVANVNVVNVYGNVSLTAEIVGGLFGTMNEDTYILNSKFILSTNDSQRLNGYYTSGGIVGINMDGSINMTTIEVPLQNVASFDNSLTNNMGASLFSGANVHPYAIGGVAGIQFGGDIVSSYTKTNVVNSHAKYAGGVVGYLDAYTSSSEVDSGNKFVENLFGYSYATNKYTQSYKSKANIYMQEVYTTGNVMANDTYHSSTAKYSYMIDGNTVASQANVEVPNGYAGGIVGLYVPHANTASKDVFAAVMGINAFHRPNGYELANADYSPVVFKNGYVSLSNGKISTTTLTYGHLMSGYLGTKTDSTGGSQTKYFAPRVGAIFGEIKNTNNVTEIKFNSGNQVSIFTKFVYNAQTITANDCARANGEKIAYTASLYNNFDFTNYENPTKNYITSNIVNIDTYILGSSKTSVKVVLNSDAASTSQEKHFKNSNTYLVFRGQDLNNVDYSSYDQTDTGIYNEWNENWQFKSPIYPTLKPSDINQFIPIDNEQELRNMRSGGKYLITKDIYLTSNWNNSRILSYITLKSAKRTDGQGINGSVYYAIYNINVVSSNTNSSFGFFLALNHSNVVNVNFVFGSALQDPTWKEPKTLNFVGSNGSQKYGFDFTGTSTNIGLLVGNLARDSKIQKCKVYLVSKEVVNNVETSLKPTYNIKYKNSTSQSSVAVNIGGVVGIIDTSSVIGTYLRFGTLNRTIDTVNENITTEIDNSNTTRSISISENTGSNSIERLNVGGLVGDVSIEGASFNGCYAKGVYLYVSSVQKAQTVNVGGLVGYATASTIPSQTQQNEQYVNAKILLSSITTNELYVGGYAGNLNLVGTGISVQAVKNSSIELTSITLKSEQITENGSTTTRNPSAYVGGFTGYTNNKIDNINVDCDITMNSLTTQSSAAANIWAGGVVGKIDNELTNATFVGDISLTTSGSSSAKTTYSRVYIGGLVGQIINRKIENSSVSGNITFLAYTTPYINNLKIGGLLGEYYGSSTMQTFTNCHVNTTIDVDDRSNVVSGNTYYAKIAGVVGSASAGSYLTLNQCSAIGTIKAASFKTGNPTKDITIAGLIADGKTNDSSGTSSSTVKIDKCLS
ncbi:MAG: hypothetical protein J6T39_01380, partial [Clostridia bacterium]|nr:hypothetical protein [Clostridia bacterium]